MKYVKRIGPSGRCFTKGRVYRVHTLSDNGRSGFIRDDQGQDQYFRLSTRLWEPVDTEEQKARYIRRVQPDPRGRVVQGKVYERKANGQIIDEKGKNFSPCMGVLPNGKTYWEPCKEFEHDGLKGIEDCDDSMEVTGTTTVSSLNGDVLTKEKLEDAIRKFKGGYQPDPWSAEYGNCLARVMEINPFPTPKVLAFGAQPTLIHHDRYIKLPTNEDSTMEIRQVTLVNGSIGEDMDDSGLIHLIKSEKTAITKLNDLAVDSKRVTAKIKEHKENIAKLVELLDSRDS